jgi:hypothetical protein
VSRWNDVKSTFFELYTLAAERTEEMARVGVKRYDRFTIARDLQHHYEDLGREVYRLVRAGEGELVATDPTVQRLVERLKALEAEREAKDDEIRDIRRRAGETGNGPQRPER